MKINEWPRHGIQALWALLTNSHLSGFVTGKIYTGKLKNVCVPGLNCYSCPGATGACPIGSLQAVIGSWNFKMAYYVAGFLIFVGALLGRLVCGFLCNILSLEPDLTVCQLISGASHQRITQCGFTGTVWAHQDMCFSSVYLKVNAVKDLCVLYVDY